MEKIFRKKTKRITIKDVADFAGVTPGTASLALNRDPSELKFSMQTITRIREAAEKLNYRPNPLAQRLVSGALAFPSVTIMAPTEHGFGSLHNEEVLIGVVLAAATAGIKADTVVPKFKNAASPEFGTPEAIDATDGFILHTWCNIEDDSVLQPLLATGKPFVLANHYVQDERIPCVGGDLLNAGSTVIRYLVELGHRYIAVMPGPKLLPKSHLYLQGMRNEMARYGMSLPDDNVNFGSYADLDGAWIDRLLTQTLRPTAFVIAADEVATKLILYLREKGFTVPDDFSVVGFGNEAYSKFFSPKLTTINEHGREIGQRAMQILANLIEKKDAETKIKLDFELVKRQSTAPPKKS
ncbi:MAG: LacI family DNA-binding transcriptional regulator [Planctomycetota bacterium]